MIRPWLLVIFAFLILIAAWSSLIFVASKYASEQVTLSSEKPR